MKTRQPDVSKLPDTESELLIPTTPDLSLRKMDRVVSFKLPKIHRRDSEADDLPDITPELMEKLKLMWNIENAVEERPIRVLVDAVRAHLDNINPYFDIMKDTQRTWFECWQFLYKIAQNLDNASESYANLRFYSVPEALRLQELRARMNLGKADTEHQAAVVEFTNELDKRLAEINDLQRKLQEITDAKDMAALSKYEMVYGIKPAASVKSASMPKPGCCALIFSLFAPKNRQAQPVVTVDRAQQDAQDFQDLRAKLITDYNYQIQHKTGLYNDYGDNGPTKSDKYRSEWNEIKAKILHNQIDFYRAQSKEVMLHCLRLYVLAIRTYYLVYGENPVADENKTSTIDAGRANHVYDDHDKIVLKAKELFKQMVKGMKGHLSLLYCLQPDRCEFMQYLDNYNNIKSQEDRDAIIAGKAADEVLEKVFPEFESPEEAFQLPKPGK